MQEHLESGYAFLFVRQIEDNHYLDFYLSRNMLAQLQLRPGSIVLAQGLHEPNPSAVSLRPSKGSEQPSLGHHPFMASIRFPNNPSVLSRFLNAAHERGIGFTSIRTHGARGDTMADVLVEGVLLKTGNAFEPGLAIALELSGPAREAGGEVVSAYPVSLGRYEVGTVLTSTYEVDLPILKGSYSKTRFNTAGRGRPFKDLEGKLRLARAQLDVTRMTVTLDISLMRVPLSLFIFNSADLRANSPVTQTILNSLPKGVNVDAIDAFEYLEQSPKAIAAGGPGGQLTGVIEMLLTSDSPLAPGTEAEIRQKLEAAQWSPDLTVRIIDLDTELKTLRCIKVPEDSGCRFFRKTLADGRYAFVEQAGEGAFGIVNKYLDLHDGRMVAGKHIRDPKAYRLRNEVEALISARDIKSSVRHLAAILGAFYDGELPVIVMDFIDYDLANHSENPYEMDKRKIHSRPRSIGEFIEMRLQLTVGLEQLHAAGFVHSDIKPANIGFALVGGEPVWKLMDFNLARRRPRSSGARKYDTTEVLAGTPLYMSPQARMLKRYVNNDVFSLGVTFFQVLCNWRFPGTPDDVSRGHFDEIDEYIADEQQGAEPELRGFSESRWNLGQVFQSGIPKEEAGTELQSIVFKMMAFRADERFETSNAVHEALLSWKKKWLQDEGPKAYDGTAST